MIDLAPSPMDAANPFAGRWKPGEPLLETQAARKGEPILMGVLPGEGIGPEVVDCALMVLAEVASAGGLAHRLEFGGAIGRVAERVCGSPLPGEVKAFCGDIFARGGVILSGPGGGRYVYDLRQHFDLFCKLNPIRVTTELAGHGPMDARHVEGVDVMVVREGASGLYQGEWQLERSPEGRGRATHFFAYSEGEVTRILTVAARLALQRRGQLAVVYKESGAVSISELWRECAVRVGREAGLAPSFLDVDYACYRLLRHPKEFDVIVTSNLFGDILSDLGGILLGSRALTYGGNYGVDGSAFYQTNHGAAYDLAGGGRCNPLGQIFSIALLLWQSFGLHAESRIIHEAVGRVLKAGWRTDDMRLPGTRVVGTRRMTELICEEIRTPGGNPALS